MDASLIPYRKVTLLGVAFANGEVELKEILEQLLVSFEQLEVASQSEWMYRKRWEN